MPLLNYLQACSEPSKLGWYKTFTLRWLSACSDLDYTKHPLFDDLITESFKFRWYKSSKFGWFHSLFSSIYSIFSSLPDRRKQAYIIQIFHNTDKPSTFCGFVWITNHPFLKSGTNINKLFHVNVVTEHQTDVNWETINTGSGTQGPGTQWSSSVALCFYGRNATCVNVLNSNVWLYHCGPQSPHYCTHSRRSSHQIVLFHTIC